MVVLSVCHRQTTSCNRQKLQQPMLPPDGYKFSFHPLPIITIPKPFFKFFILFFQYIIKWINFVVFDKIMYLFSFF